MSGLHSKSKCVQICCQCTISLVQKGEYVVHRDQDAGAA